MRLLRDRAILFICDVQDKFAPKTYGYQGVLQASIMMIKSAKILNIPTITTQHNKKAFGQTCKQLTQNYPEQSYIIPKTKFSMIIPQVQTLLEKYKNRNQIILIGMETQICILQTALDLLKGKYQVYLLADAITSLRSWERTIAFKRLEKQGAIITTYQSAIFDMIKDSKDQKFKQILQIIKQNSREKAISHL